MSLVPTVAIARHVAFLRAVNVGGRVARMDAVRAAFTSAALANVWTFLASGNVVFDSPVVDTGMLERRIEEALARALGYQVRTFVRSDGDVRSIARRRVFTGDRRADRPSTIHIGFLPRSPTPAERRWLSSMCTDEDRLEAIGRELYWLRRGPLMASPMSSALLERTLRCEATFRNRNTIVRLSAKLEGKT